MVQMFVSPTGAKTDLRIGKDSPSQSGKSEHLVYNYRPYTEQIVNKIDIQFGQINDPLEITSVIPGHGFGEGLVWIGYKHGGAHGEPISEISNESAKTPGGETFQL